MILDLHHAEANPVNVDRNPSFLDLENFGLDQKSRRTFFKCLKSISGDSEHIWFFS